MIQQERIKNLNSTATKDGKCIIYWMQQSQRIEYNHAFEFALNRAEKSKLPLVVFFGLTDNYPEANARHYSFMLEGLKELEQALKQKNVSFICQLTTPVEGLLKLSHELEAEVVICDRGYTKIQKKWREDLAKKINCPLIQVETDVIVPIETASNKEEYAARTIRPKIHKHLKDFLIPVKTLDKPLAKKINLKIDSLDLSNLEKLVSKLKIDHSIMPTKFKGGTNEAKKILNFFIDNHLNHYADDRNQPQLNTISNLSPYLHFGQISSLEIALKILESAASKEQKDVFLEELIVRRELSMNFCEFNKNYDKLEGLPNWCQQTLQKHAQDKRPFIYTKEQFEKAQTHDQIWNAAQNEMVQTGKMHGYMRMYWGKKILEWSKNPSQAYQTALYLNNKYELDGRDPNGFTGVAWCFGKHDRPWGPERPIFGLVRFMAESGIKKKIDWQNYVSKWTTL